ncbi:ISNCY family transposase [bacterium]|nr:ISNCY family transposase [bacterium]MCK4436393.1 ISNCY family transposase [bacterium]
MELKIIGVEKAVHRYTVIKDCLKKRIKAIQASQILGLSYIHFLRLKKKVAIHGFQALIRVSRPSPRKIPEAKAKVIAGLYEDYYSDFNVLHFKDKLEDVHKILLSYEAIRKILIEYNLHTPKKKKIVHRRRRRMPKAGMLVQMDSSQHNWIEHIPEKWWLVAMIDDATNETPYAKFYPSDTVFANMHVIRRFTELKGIFMCLYPDKASHFKTTRHGGTHYDVKEQQKDTQIERALDELGINIINANSPQAKGRIERLFRFFQDRLIKEMRLAGIRDYTQANKFLINKFLPWYNKRYTHTAESAYLPLPKDKNLDTIFCIKKERTVNHDNTISWDNQIIQIPPSDIRLSFAKAKVDACLLKNRDVLVLYKNTIIAKAKLSKSNKFIKEQQLEQKILGAKLYEPVGV